VAKATEFFEKAAKAGDLQSPYNLYTMSASLLLLVAPIRFPSCDRVLCRYHSEREYEKAIGWLKRAAELGDMRGLYTLGAW